MPNYDNNYDPIRHLLRMGVVINYVAGLAVRGQYFHPERLVEVREGMAADEERSVLAHEAAHVELRHVPQEFWCYSMRDERLASAMAGRRLINHHEMVRLQSLGMDERELSKELRVARAILRAYLWLSGPAWRLAA